MTTPEKILEGAMEILERDGWVQGDYFVHPEDEEDIDKLVDMAQTAPVCSMGAIYRSAFGYAANVGTEGCMLFADPKTRELARQAEHLLAETIQNRSVIGWNDEDGRSKEDVILAFKKAAHHDSE